MKNTTKPTPESPRRNRLRNVPIERKPSLPQRTEELSELLSEHFAKSTVLSQDKIISSDNIIYIISLDNFDNGVGGNKMVVRFPVLDAETRPDTHHPSSQAWVTAKWRKEGAQVPKVLFVDPKGNYLVESFLPGANLRKYPAEEHLPVMLEVGEQLNLMHKVTLQGYGTLVCDDDGDMKGQFDDWKSYFDYLFINRLENLVKTKVWASLPLIENVNALYEKYTPHLMSFTKPVLLHGDLNSDNIRVARPGGEGGDLKLLGILDFCDCLSGDPLFEFGALLETSNDWQCIEEVDKTYHGDLAKHEDVIIFYAIFISIFYMNEDRLRLDRIYLYTKKIIEFFARLNIHVEG